ncbi:hypothetical protein F5Y06DRAFT_56942 [Hypoxylon sp. FL0890]|nr:hypothetical protein F5Y06DRAFT_56942 [Hypoxylon sp. FL0890]
MIAYLRCAVFMGWNLLISSSQNTECQSGQPTWRLRHKVGSYLTSEHFSLFVIANGLPSKFEDIFADGRKDTGSDDDLNEIHPKLHYVRRDFYRV